MINDFVLPNENDLPNDVLSLQKMVLSLLSLVKQQRTEIKDLKKQVKKMQQMLFGKKSEKLPKEPKNAEKQGVSAAEENVTKKHGGGGRTAIPADLRREETFTRSSRRDEMLVERTIKNKNSPR